MCPAGEGKLLITKDRDGDIVISIYGKDTFTGEDVSVSVEFCEPTMGGGDAWKYNKLNALFK